MRQPFYRNTLVRNHSTCVVRCTLPIDLEDLNYEVLILAVPSNMPYTLGLRCRSTITTPTTIAIRPGEPATVSETFIAVDWPIWLAWENQDLSKFTPASAPLIKPGDTTVTATVTTLETGLEPATRSGMASTVPTQTSNDVPRDDSRHTALRSSNDLSTGAVAGIGVGAGIAVIVLLLGLVLLLLRRRKRRHQKSEDGRASKTLSELAYSPMSHGSLTFATYAAPREAEGDTPQPRAEMSGGWEGHEIQYRHVRT